MVGALSVLGKSVNPQRALLCLKNTPLKWKLEVLGRRQGNRTEEEGGSGLKKECLLDFSIAEVFMVKTGRAWAQSKDPQKKQMKVKVDMQISIRQTKGYNWRVRDSRAKEETGSSGSGWAVHLQWEDTNQPTEQDIQEGICVLRVGRMRNKEVIWTRSSEPDWPRDDCMDWHITSKLRKG